MFYLSVCLFIVVFCEAFEGYETIADLSHRLISIDQSIFFYCPLNMFLLKAN